MKISMDPAHTETAMQGLNYQSSKKQFYRSNHSVKAANNPVTGNVYYSCGLTLSHHIWNVKEYFKYECKITIPKIKKTTPWDTLRVVIKNCRIILGD